MVPLLDELPDFPLLVLLPDLLLPVPLWLERLPLNWLFTLPEPDLPDPEPLFTVEPPDRPAVFPAVLLCLEPAVLPDAEPLPVCRLPELLPPGVCVDELPAPNPLVCACTLPVATATSNATDIIKIFMRCFG